LAAPLALGYTTKLFELEVTRFDNIKRNCASHTLTEDARRAIPLRAHESIQLGGGLVLAAFLGLGDATNLFELGSFGYRKATRRRHRTPDRRSGAPIHFCFAVRTEMGACPGTLMLRCPYGSQPLRSPRPRDCKRAFARWDRSSTETEYKFTLFISGSSDHI
jgi:hypothetical protein